MIKVYSKANCMQCMMTKELLTQREIPFTEIRVDIDQGAMEYLKGLGVSSLPYVETLKHSWIGFRPDAIDNISEEEWQV